MYTSIVEYSLIGAAVMYIVWYNIKHNELHGHEETHKEKLKVNFRNTVFGKQV